MIQTHARFEEAKFFYKQMLMNPTNPEFDYFLNAFLASARSITWVMKNEYGHADGWEEWYEAKVLNEEDRALLKLMSSLRNNSQKVRPVKSSPYLSVTIPAGKIDDALLARIQENVGRQGLLSINTDADGNPTSISAQLELEGIDGLPIVLDGVVEQFDRSVHGEESAPIREQCGEYLLMLKELTEECEAAFKPRLPN